MLGECYYPNAGGEGIALNTLQNYINHVHPVEPIGRGTMPDYPIVESLNDLQDGLDRPLLFVFDLIKQRL